MVFNLGTKIAITITVFIVATFSLASLQPHFSKSLAVAQPDNSPAINMTQQCPRLGKTLGGIPVPSGNVCDIVVVRQTPEIMGHNGLVMNKFTLMNSVIGKIQYPEFRSMVYGLCLQDVQIFSH